MTAIFWRRGVGVEVNTIQVLPPGAVARASWPENYAARGAADQVIRLEGSHV